MSKQRKLASVLVPLILAGTLVLPATAYASTSATAPQTLSVQAGTLSISNTSPRNITAAIDNSASGYLPGADWSDATGSGNGWQGSVAMTDFIYTGDWMPVGAAPALASDTSSAYTGSADGNTYTVTVTGTSGSTVDFSYASSNGASGTGSATAGSPATVGNHGLSIIFSSSSTYSTGDAYQIHVGAQNPDALTLANTVNTAIANVASQSYTSPPLFANQQATVVGGGDTYGSAVPFLSAATNSGMGNFNVTPEAVIDTDINSWAATYVANVEYTISSGPYALASNSTPSNSTSSSPVVDSIEEANTGQNATWIIQGSGFGTLPSSDFGYGDTPYFQIYYNGGVSAGNTGNVILIDYETWTNNLIVIKGFNDGYYENLGWPIDPGTAYRLLIQNPQSGSSTNYYGTFPSQISAPNGAPIISNVAVTNYGQSGMTVTVTGSGYGTQPDTLPYTGDEAGFGLTIVNQGSLGNTDNADPLTYTQWTNTEIQVEVPSSEVSLFTTSSTADIVVINQYGDSLPVTFNGNGSFS